MAGQAYSPLCMLASPAAGTGCNGPVALAGGQRKSESACCSRGAGQGRAGQGSLLKEGPRKAQKKKEFPTERCSTSRSLAARLMRCSVATAASACGAGAGGCGGYSRGSRAFRARLAAQLGAGSLEHTDRSAARRAPRAVSGALPRDRHACIGRGAHRGSRAARLHAGRPALEVARFGGHHLAAGLCLHSGSRHFGLGRLQLHQRLHGGKAGGRGAQRCEASRVGSQQAQACSCSHPARPTPSEGSPASAARNPPAVCNCRRRERQASAPSRPPVIGLKKP